MRRAWWRLLWDDPREAAFDVGLWLVLAAIGKFLLWLVPTTTPPQAYDWIGGIPVVEVAEFVLSLGLLVRRRLPVVLMALLTALTIAQTSCMLFGPGPLLWVNVTDDAWVPGTTPFIIYAVAVYAADRWRALGWVLIGLTIVVAARPWELPPDVSVTASALITTLLPAVLGLYVGARRRLVQALRDRAERAEREQHLLAEQARADERARLASEMHDVVTHRVSLMVLQAGALGVTASDEETRRAAEELRASGCQALEELRDLVGVLRQEVAERQDHDDPATATPLDLAGLVADSTAVGMSVAFVEEGNPALVSPAVGRTAHRVVREALTNAHKHASGARVRVCASYDADRVKLSVHNSAGRAAQVRGLVEHGSGSGLLGLRQRVELIGGSFRAEPNDAGGFEVDAILPVYVPTGEGNADD